MSERELVHELKETIRDLSKEKENADNTIKQKESRIKQVLIKLEHATTDVKSLGHKVGEQSRELASLQIKLETKERLLNEALEKIRELKNELNADDSTVNSIEETTITDNNEEQTNEED
jgi:chromosome segregation ATPase